MTIKLKDCKYDGEGTFKIADYPTSAKVSKEERAKYEELTAKNTQKMAELQDKLYAEGKEGVVILLQALDAAGKDSTIKHVMSGVNPQGVTVCSFKSPSSEELAHDYLWRAIKNLPKRGYIGLFNRSYYEDVLVVRVHEMQKGYAMPARTIDMPERRFFQKRFKQIRNFEEYLWDNGYRVLKIFLNVGQDEQKERFLARIDDESKNWKFSSSDLKERALWPKYMKAFEDTIGHTSTKQAPWYVIPADQKWYARYLVSEAVVDVLEACDPHYPEMPEEQVIHLADCKAQLLGEDGGDPKAAEAAKAAAPEAEAKPAKKAKKAGKKAKKAKKSDE